jgi:murein DD-endopeptidase MepM/ murein hydrolase activator NlpD
MYKQKGRQTKMKQTMKHYKKTLVFILIFSSLLLVGLSRGAQAASAADVTSAAGLVTAPSALNVRSAPSTSGSVIGWLGSGTYVTLLSKTGNWWRVEYASGATGYVSATYIKYVSGTIAKRTTAAVNVRSCAGTGYASNGVVPGGTTVLVLSETGGWSRVLYGGWRIGYISSAYLSSLMAWPVPASHKINQYYGAHEGIDIGASVRGVTGDSVVSAMNGTVVYAGWLSGYGYVVYINSVYNGKPVQTRYGHLASAPLVSAGSTVGAGQKIGAMGNTGTSSGVHLHFEVRIRSSWDSCVANAASTPVNPLGYVS